MQASDLMTREVVSAAPTMSVRDVARLLLAHHVSAAPVIDEAGALVGMVSEGDLIGRSDADRQARRDWWLALIAEGEPLSADFLASLRRTELTARDVMSAPVVSVTESTDAREIAELLGTHRIKRVPVARDGHVVGIVSRADLLRGLGVENEREQATRPASRSHNLVAEAFLTLDEMFHHRHTPRSPAPDTHPSAAPEPVSAADFRDLVADFQREKLHHADAASRAAAELRRQEVKALIDQHITDSTWRAVCHHAREAAEHGEKEMLLLRFPSDLCTDGGRAINAPLPDWPKTLRGEAAEIYLRWQSDLKPSGFHLTARVLDFPGGKPGDIGLFLIWGL